MSAVSAASSTLGALLGHLTEIWNAELCGQILGLMGGAPECLLAQCREHHEVFVIENEYGSSEAHWLVRPANGLDTFTVRPRRPYGHRPTIQHFGLGNINMISHDGHCHDNEYRQQAGKNRLWRVRQQRYTDEH